MSGLTLPTLSDSRQWGASSGASSCDRCDCCPYGYHIHLDFLRYCENLALVPPSSPTPSELRRKRRRRQRQSMEVLLGFLPPLPQTPITRESYMLPSVPASPTTSIASPTYSAHEDSAKDRALDEAVKDFESTLQKSYKKPPTNHIAPSPIRLSLTQFKEHTQTCLPPPEPENQEKYCEGDGRSTSALQNIRKHMAYSLRRVRELEDQIKVIPKLQMQISALKEEKKVLESRVPLLSELQTPPLVKTITPTRINLVSLNSLNGRVRSTSFSEKQLQIKSTRDAGVLCSVIMRNVGTATQSTRCRTLGVGNDSVLLPAKPITYNTYIQTELTMADVLSRLEAQHQIHSIQQKFIKQEPVMKTIALQTNFLSKNAYCQATPSTRSTAIEAVLKPMTSEVSVQAVNDSRSISCSAAFPVKCQKCDEQKKIAVSDKNNYNNGISLSLLGVLKEGTLLKDKQHQKTHKNFGVQVTPLTDTKQTQSVMRSETKATQKSVTTNSRSQQYDLLGVTKYTDTENLIEITDRCCNTSGPELVDASCGESIKPHVMISCADNYCDTCKEQIKSLAKGFVTSDVSRIPRPTGVVTSTKTRSVVEQTSNIKIPMYVNNVESNKLLIKHENINETIQDSNKYESIQVSTHTPENIAQVMPIQNIQKEKSEPSKEMRAALKVLNDSGRKSPKGFESSYLRNVNTIIKKEWFMISSENDSDPAIVSDYMQYFGNISNELLQYIVNITDATGNTAMHYAVSHGNFDMVSVLLNSGVCEINQANGAGYTSVMLVSLAELTSTSHKAVVKRLFQLADINLPAKQHGQTALMLAVSHGRYDMVNMLLETGADMNIQDEDGSTALMCAAEHGHTNIVKLFLSQPECDSSIVDVDGSTALKIALEAGHKDIGVLLYAYERKSRTNSPHGSLRSHRQHSTSTPSSPISSRRNIKPTK